MIRAIIACAVVSMASVAAANMECSPKIQDHFGRNSCDFFDGKPDTAWMIFTIGLTRPYLHEEDTPENREKLRRWTDSLFLTYDLRHWTSLEQRSNPPPDSLMEWAYQVLIRKSSVLSIADLDFVKGMSYRDEPPSVRLRPSKRILDVTPQASSLFDANGRSIPNGMPAGKLHNQPTRMRFRK